MITQQPERQSDLVSMIYEPAFAHEPLVRGICAGELASRCDQLGGQVFADRPPTGISQQLVCLYVLVFGTMKKINERAEEARWIAERQITLQAQLKHVFAQKHN